MVSMRSFALVFAIRIFHVQAIKANEGSWQQAEAANTQEEPAGVAEYKNWFMAHKSTPQRIQNVCTCVCEYGKNAEAKFFNCKSNTWLQSLCKTFVCWAVEMWLEFVENVGRGRWVR